MHMRIFPHQMMASSSLWVVADATVEANNAEAERRPRKRSMPMQEPSSTCKNCSPYFTTSSPPTTTSIKLKGVTTTTSQRFHNKKKRHRRSRSPPKTTTTTTTKKTSCSSSSPHFSNSPSSVSGSLATLGPIFLTWTELSPSSICTKTNNKMSSSRRCACACIQQSSSNNNNEEDHMYHHSQQSGYIQPCSSINPNNSKQQHGLTTTPQICEFCQIIIQDAIRHFWNKCHIFDKCYESKMKEYYGFIMAGATTRPTADDSCISSSNLSYPNSSTTTSDEDDDNDMNATTLRQQHCTIELPSRRQVVSCSSTKTTTNLLREAKMQEGGSGGKLLLPLLSLWSSSCLEVASIVAEESVRHLCVNGCYLKAYSPCRDWIELRQTIHQHTDVPVGKPQASFSLEDCNIFILDESVNYTRI